MKNLLITLDFLPANGGVATYLGAMCDQFKPESIIVLAPRYKNAFLVDSKKPYKIIREKLLYSLIRPRWLKLYFIAGKIIKENQIEHIFISHVLPVGIICLLLKKPYSVILHGMDVQLARTKPWKAWLFRKIIRQADEVICNSKFTLGLVQAEVGILNSMSVTYPCPKDFPINLNSEVSIRAKYKISSDKLILLSVSRLVSRKGIDMALAVCAFLIHQMEQKIHYLIVGDGPQKEQLKKLIADYSLKDHVTIIDDVKDQEIPQYYRESDIFILLPRAEKLVDVEGFGIVFLEAGLFKKPVIAGNSGGVDEAVIDQLNGLLCDPLNFEDVATKILYLIQNPEKRLGYGQNGYERVKSEFVWSKQFKSLVDKYN